MKAVLALLITWLAMLLTLSSVDIGLIDGIFVIADVLEIPYENSWPSHHLGRLSRYWHSPMAIVSNVSPKRYQRCVSALIMSLMSSARGSADMVGRALILSNGGSEGMASSVAAAITSSRLFSS